MSWTNPLPGATTITGTATKDVAISALQAKHTDAGLWATWAATLMSEQLSAINGATGTDLLSGTITSINAAIAAVPSYDAGVLTFTNDAFTDQLLTDLKQSLSDQLATPSTGLGETVENALFARAVLRVNDERVKVYNENCDFFSSKNYDLPPGALSAKITEMTTITNDKLTDISAAILHESATLAANNNIEVLKITTSLIEVIGKLYDSGLMREFEIKKTNILQTLDAYKAKLGMYEVKGNLTSKAAQMSMEALIRAMSVEVEAFKGVAQSAAQMVASALNGVNISSSFGFSGNEASDLTKYNTGSNPPPNTTVINLHGTIAPPDGFSAP